MYKSKLSIVTKLQKSEQFEDLYREQMLRSCIKLKQEEYFELISLLDK